MTRTPTEITGVAGVRCLSRVRHGAVLCVLALAACGTEGADREGPTAHPGGRVEGASATAPAGGADDAELAFMALLNSIAKPCPEEPATEETPAGSGPAAPPTAPLPEISIPDEPPADGQGDMQPEFQEVELSSVEQCAASLHVRRIAKALDGKADPTPSHVGEVLRGLGYIDERIHGPQRSGGEVKFTLDLRMMGGRLCLSGSVSGAGTTVEPYGASVEVDCPDVGRPH